MFDARDHAYMARALTLARHGLYTTQPNPRVGCVLVRDGMVVGEGWHRRAGAAHAEVEALAQAGGRARGATAYVTLEPCCHHGRTPPCTEALIAAGVRRVIAAMRDPNPRVAGQGLAQLAAAGLEVECGLLEPRAVALNPGFVSRHTRGRPWLRAKLAMTLDGRTADAGGKSQWITGPAARLDVQRLRARSSAIVTGIGTVLADDPALTVRLRDPGWEPASGAQPGAFEPPQPLRVIVDSRLRTPPGARLFATPGPVLIACAAAADTAPPQAELIRLPGPGGQVDLAALLDHLATREVNEVLLEAGAILSGAALAAGLVDELVIYLAPKLLGDRGRGLFALPGIAGLGQALPLEITEVRAVGDDWRVTARPRAAAGEA